MVVTLAGEPGVAGFSDGTGSAAHFSEPRGVAVDSNEMIYVADGGNNRIRLVSQAGETTTLAGNGTFGFADGPADTAMFANPRAIDVDAGGNVYVADTENHRIRLVVHDTVTTVAGSGIPGFADGTGPDAQFSSPAGIATDGSGNLYVADTQNNRIRHVTPAGVVTTVAGSGDAGYIDGTGTNAQFSAPVGIDEAGNVYVGDAGNNRIREISPAGVVTIVAGSSAGYADGTGTAAQFSQPGGVAADSSGNVYVADSENHSLRKIAVESPTTVTITSLVARTVRRGVLVRWTTAHAVGTIGFNLWRRQGSQSAFRKLNRTLIAAKAGFAGGRYSFLDRTVRGSETYLYMLELVDIGNTRRFTAQTAVSSGQGR